MKDKLIQLFVSDMDGTLLQRDFSISDEDVKAIKLLEEKGIIFAVATGRIWYDAAVICGRHNLRPYIIANNGTCIFTPDRELIYARPVQKSILGEIVDMLDQIGICYGLGTDKNFIVSENWEAVFDRDNWELQEKGILIADSKVVFAKKELTGQQGVQVVPSVREMLGYCESVYNISLLTYNQEKLEQIQEKMEAYQTLMVSVSGTHNAEIMEKYGTKAHALAYLCKLLRISVEETAAVGDNLNDLQMIEMAGIGIAMDNALEEVKSSSNFVTKAYHSYGVSHAIQTILSGMA
jgi:Cof subfamily protein (haloacid dehalogenase superfamily)